MLLVANPSSNDAIELTAKATKGSPSSLRHPTLPVSLTPSNMDLLHLIWDSLVVTPQNLQYFEIGEFDLLCIFVGI